MAFRPGRDVRARRRRREVGLVRASLARGAGPGAARRISRRLLLVDLVLAGLVVGCAWSTLMVGFSAEWTRAPFVAEPAVRWVMFGLLGLLALLARRLPTLALVAAAGLFGWWPLGSALLALTSFTAAGRARSARRGALVLAAAAGLGYVVALWSSSEPVLVVTGLHLVSTLLCLALPAGAQALFIAADRHLARLRERTVLLEEANRLAQTVARFQERSRIAQEMHDQLGHRLSVIGLHAGALELSLSSAPAGRVGSGAAGVAPAGTASADEARLIRGTAQGAMRDLRAILGLLGRPEDGVSGGRPEAGVSGGRPEAGVAAGSRADVEQFVGRIREAGVEVLVTWQGPDSAGLPAPAGLAVRSAVREGLTNVLRHAPGATVALRVRREPERVTVELRNTRRNPGTPAAPAGAGTGLGLPEVERRVRAAGGRFRAGPAPDGGFVLTVMVPADPDGAAAVLDADPAGGPAGPWVTEPVQDVPAGPAGGTRVVVVAAGLVAVAGAVSVAVQFMPSLVPGPVLQPARVTVGMSLDEVLSAVGDDDAVARLAGRDIARPEPPGSLCTFQQTWAADGPIDVTRYCFVEGRLVQLDRRPVPVPTPPGGPDEVTR